MGMKSRLSFFIVMVILLMVSVAWANPPVPVSADALPDQAAASADSVPFDPFDSPGGQSYGDEDAELHAVADPIEGFNRAMFVFNDKLYYWVLKPVASGYRVVVPTPVRVSVNDFFFNLLGPVRLFNCFFQGKWRSAEGEFCRFVVNTTAGCLGLFNVVRDKPSFNPPEEDFGQTLGYYAVGNGFYIIWPLFGPSTVRDTVGCVGDSFLDPVGYLDPCQLRLSVTGVRGVNDGSYYIDSYDALMKDALDPYVVMREAYLQLRRKEISE